MSGKDRGDAEILVKVLGCAILWVIGILGLVALATRVFCMVSGMCP